MFWPLFNMNSIGMYLVVFSARLTLHLLCFQFSQRTNCLGHIRQYLHWYSIYIVTHLHFAIFTPTAAPKIRSLCKI